MCGLSNGILCLMQPLFYWMSSQLLYILQINWWCLVCIESACSSTAFFPSFLSYQSTYLASLASFLPTDKQILYQVFWHLLWHARKVAQLSIASCALLLLCVLHRIFYTLKKRKPVHFRWACSHLESKLFCQYGNIWPNSYQRDALVWQSIIILALLNQSVHLVTVRSNVSLLTEQLWRWSYEKITQLTQ